MASFGEQLLNSAIRSSMAEEKAKRAAHAKTETAKLALLANPTKLDKLVSNFTTMVSPSRAKLGTDFASKTDAADANIPDDHPLKGYGPGLRETLNQALRAPENEGYSINQIVLEMADRNLAPLVEKSHEYKYRKDYAPSNWAGLFGEDEDVKALPGYEEFKERKGAITPEEMKTSYKQALGFGAGLSGAGQLTRRAAMKWGGKRAASWGAKRLVIGAALGPHIALASLVAIPAFKIFDTTANIINRTHFGKSQGAWTKGITEVILGGLVPAYTGHKLLTKSITAATKSGLIKGVAEDVLSRFPTAKNAIDVGRTAKLAARDEAIVAENIAKEAGKPKNKRVFFKAAEDAEEYAGRRQGLEGLTKLEKREINKDLTAPFKNQFLGIQTKKLEKLSKVFSEFTDEQADIVLKRAKTTGVRKATQTVKEGVEVLEDQRLKEIQDGVAKGIREIDRTQMERYTTDELLAPFKSKKTTRLAKAGESKAKKIEKTTKKADTAVDKEILAAKIAEFGEDIATSRAAVADMGARFEKSGLYKTKAGKTVLKKGGKTKSTEQVPDEVIVAKEAEIAAANNLTGKGYVKDTESILLRKLVKLHDDYSIQAKALDDSGARSSVINDANREFHAKLAQIRNDLPEGLKKVTYESAQRRVAEAATKPVPDGMEEISYQEAKRRILKNMMAKKNPVKEEVQIRPAIENAKESIGKQLGKQQGRPLLKGETDDAEWLARAGESETVEDVFATTDGLIKEEFDPSKWKFFLAGAATIPLLTLFEPGEAEASMSGEVLKVAANTKVSKFVMDSLKSAGKSLKQLRKEIIDGGYVYIPPAEGQKFFGERMNSISVSGMVAERGEKLADQVIRSKSLPFGFDRLMGVAGFSRLFMKAGGEASVELGNRHLVSGHMTEKGLRVLDNILTDIPGYNANPKEIIDIMKPLADKFGGQVGAYNSIEYHLKHITAVRNKSLKNLKKLKGAEKEQEMLGIAEANDSLKKLEVAAAELKPVVRKFEKDYLDTVKMLSKDRADVRMALAAEDSADFKSNPWLKELMSFEEIEAVGYHKKLMEEYAEAIIKSHGKDAVISSKPYIHHAFHPSWKTKHINSELERLKLGIKPHPPFSEFHSRAKYSRQLVPHIGYNTGRYIPDAEKRIQMGEFWGRGKKNSWWALRQSPMVQGSNALRDFFQRIHDAGIPASDHWSNRAANWYSAIEVFRLLGFSTGVAFKHLFKIPGTWAQLGFTSAIKHIPESVKIFARTFAEGPRGRDLARQLNLTGVKGEKAATDLIAKTFSRQYGYMNTIMDMDMAVNVNSTFETGLKWANEKGGVLVRAVEHFDRVHGILAASSQAAKKGMTAKQAVYGVVDTVLKNNFLSGVLNPSWMRSPKTRALFLFQNTAFKIAERRLVGAIKAVELSKAVGKSIKEKGLKQSLAELRGIKQFIKEGEHEFKESIILDALNADRGYFGTPQSVQFMKEMLIMGAIAGSGGVAGVNLWEHVNHVPFLKGHTRYPVLATSPIINAIFDVKSNRAAAAKASKAPEFMMTDFLKEWLWQGKYGPYPQSVKKGMRLSNGDIPKRYKDGPWKYLFSIPATE